MTKIEELFGEGVMFKDLTHEQRNQYNRVIAKAFRERHVLPEPEHQTTTIEQLFGEGVMLKDLTREQLNEYRRFSQNKHRSQLSVEERRKKDRDKMRKYREKNSDKYRKYQREYHQKRRANDPEFNERTLLHAYNSLKKRLNK